MVSLVALAVAAVEQVALLQTAVQVLRAKAMPVALELLLIQPLLMVHRVVAVQVQLDWEGGLV
jgi:hypothetical protein